jgi:sugar lactone lactonase YvrE
MRIFLRGIAAIGAILAIAIVAIAIVFGGGERLEDRTTDPLLPGSALQTVIDLELPAGNVAVSAGGRVFFTYHPEASPPVQLAEIVSGEPVPFPAEAAPFQSLLALRIDRQNRLWALDFAHHGTGQPRIFAFDLATNRLLESYDFPKEVAPLGSMLNDFQVDPSGRRIYIADTSIFGFRPALVVYDVEKKTSRRVLERHRSVVAKPYRIDAAGRDMVFFGIFSLRIGVDSIALDRRGEWLYFAPVSDDRMYRIATADLEDESLDAGALGDRVEDYGPKTLSDGLSMDLDGRIYITDMEHSAIHTLSPDRVLRTVVKDPKLRWPDGLSFGPDRWLYVTASALHEVILRSRANVRAKAPYQIFRFRPGPPAIPGS